MTSIAMVGVGAIGGAVAAGLGDAGRRVTLCIRTPFERLERELDGRVTTYDHPVLADPSRATPADWLLICTKAHQTRAALPWFERLAGPRTRVAVMQNGVDHMDRIEPLFDGQPIVPAIIMLPAETTAPGCVRQGRAGTLIVPDESAGREFAHLFAGQDAVSVTLSDDFLSVAWSKLVHNAAGGAICALSLRENGVVAEPGMRELVLGLMREVMQVGRAEGANLSDELPQEIIHRHASHLRNHWTSIAVDRRDGKPMEWEARNAIVGRVARRHGIPTPLNDAMTALLAAADAALASRGPRGDGDDA